jgi:hypothetical protein
MKRLLDYAVDMYDHGAKEGISAGAYVRKGRGMGRVQEPIHNCFGAT